MIFGRPITFLNFFSRPIAFSFRTGPTVPRNATLDIISACCGELGHEHPLKPTYTGKPDSPRETNSDRERTQRGDSKRWDAAWEEKARRFVERECPPSRHRRRRPSTRDTLLLRLQPVAGGRKNTCFLLRSRCRFSWLSMKEGNLTAPPLPISSLTRSYNPNVILTQMRFRRLRSRSTSWPWQRSCNPQSDLSLK
jgi:hypothetical protein